jgi:hypothetical protein
MEKSLTTGGRWPSGPTRELGSTCVTVMQPLLGND